MLAYTANDQWQPGIGDPTFMGWVTVLAYFAAAYLCWKASRARRLMANPSNGLRLFWSTLALGLAFLGVNKQLDLQTWLTLFAKHMAMSEGWYRERRAVQTAFIGVIALSGTAALLGMRRLAGAATRPVLTALAGTVLLLCFILIRASSFHHVDRALGVRLGGLKMNWILELGSIACIGTAAWSSLRHPRSKP